MERGEIPHGKTAACLRLAPVLIMSGLRLVATSSVVRDRIFWYTAHHIDIPMRISPPSYFPWTGIASVDADKPTEV